MGGAQTPNKGVGSISTFISLSSERAPMFVVCTHALLVSMRNSTLNSHGLLLRNSKGVRVVQYIPALNQSAVQSLLC